MAQIIAFINPSSFSALLGNGGAARIGLENGNGLLNDGENIFYVYADGRMENEPFDHESAKAAVTLLVPDDLEEFDKYQPTGDFAVINHNRTRLNYPNRYIRFVSHKSCWAIVPDSEVAGSKYHTIATQLTGESEFNFEAMWQIITDTEIKKTIDEICTAVLSGECLDNLAIPRCLHYAQNEFEKLKEVIGAMYDQSNPHHLNAYRTFYKNLIKPSL